MKQKRRQGLGKGEEDALAKAAKKVKRWPLGFGKCADWKNAEYHRGEG